MSHSFPLARSADEALRAPGEAALTRHHAGELAAQLPGELTVIGFETEWISFDTAEAAKLAERIEAGVGEGFVQRYEDASGAPVLAITYWKIAEPEMEASAPAPVATPEPAPDDHTDDLYFRSGRTKKRGRKRKVDPNQLDLFGKDEGA